MNTPIVPRKTTARPARKQARPAQSTQPHADLHNKVAQGDIPPHLTPAGVRKFVSDQTQEAAQQAELAALDTDRKGPPPVDLHNEGVQAILEGDAPDDAAAMRAALGMPPGEPALQHTSDELAEDWRKGGYLEKGKVPKDPWKNEFVYVCPGSHGDFDITSLGADGEAGGEDFDKDINSWDVE